MTPLSGSSISIFEHPNHPTPATRGKLSSWHFIFLSGTRIVLWSCSACLPVFAFVHFIFYDILLHQPCCWYFLPRRIRVLRLEMFLARFLSAEGGADTGPWRGQYSGPEPRQAQTETEICPDSRVSRPARTLAIHQCFGSRAARRKY